MHTSLLTGDVLALDSEMNIYRLQLRKSELKVVFVFCTSIICYCTLSKPDMM